MNTLRYLTFFLIFAFSSLGGFTFGAEQGFAPSGRTDAKQPVVEEEVPQVPPSTPTLDILQHRNILFIGVDQVTNPVVQLEAVWLLFFHRDNPQIEIIPIFPTVAGDDLMRDYELAVNFELTTEGAPSNNFWNTLQRREILWHNYVLLDERALNAITDLLEIPRGRDQSYLQHWDDNAGASIHGQLALFDQACKSFAQHELVEDISPFLNNLTPFLSTDIPVNEIFTDWRLLNIYGENLRCDFPTLTALQD